MFASELAIALIVTGGWPQIARCGAAADRRFTALAQFRTHAARRGGRAGTVPATAAAALMRWASSPRHHAGLADLLGIAASNVGLP